MTQPVIILGAARSGTKYLRDILSLAPNAAKVPYDINYIWRYRNGEHPDDALPAANVTPAIAKFVGEQVHRLADASPASDAVVFEKTVGNTLRVPFVDAVFPNAKLIHLVRDGRAVTESAMRQWTEPMDKGRLFEKLKGVPLQNLGYVAWFGTNFLKGKLSGRSGGHVWGPRYPGIDADIEATRELTEICAEQWRASVALAREGLAAIAPERQMTVRYDALVSGTDALGEVAEFCGLHDVPAILAQHKQRVDTRTDDKWKERLSQPQKNRMNAILAPLLDELGYAQEQAA
jgi:hypothetical protein